MIHDYRSKGPNFYENLTDKETKEAISFCEDVIGVEYRVSFDKATNVNMFLNAFYDEAWNEYKTCCGDIVE